MKYIVQYRLALLLIILASVRFVHLSSEIDLPHSWRQYDTKQYIDSYYFGEADFLAPSVCWMGGHKTLLLEFPLPEYLIAKLYSLFGPDILVARLFFLVFFVISAFFLYKSLKLIFTDSWIPEMATLIYGMMPLSLFYSRAIHIDFFVLAFSTGFLYFMLRALLERRMLWMWIAWALACIGFVTKAPYIFFLTLPILVFAIQQKQFKWLLLRAWIFIVPVVLLYLWTNYTKEVNGRIPDWYYIPNFNRFTHMWYWYFGIWEQRLMASNWLLLGERLLTEIAGYIGVMVLVLGLAIGKKNQAWWWAISLFGGTILYILIFFNLNLMHDYYQLPFTISLSVLIALGIHELFRRIPWSKVRLAAMAILVLLVGLEGVYYAETTYYERDEDFEKVALEIRKNSSPDDLVIVCFGGLSPQCPLILQPANRFGWSIPIHDMTPELIYRLYKEAGATRLAVVYDGYFSGEFQFFFEAMQEKIGVPLDDKGKALYMCKLKM